MGNDRTPSTGGSSQADIDAKLYKVLLDLELRLDSKFEKSREQNKEDTKNIVELAVTRAVQPVLAEIQGIKQQLQDGNRRFDDQSSRITNATKMAAQAKDEVAAARLSLTATATERQFQPQDPNVPPVTSGGWISVKEIAPILTAIGSLIAVLMASFAVYRSPPPPSEQPAATSPTPRIAPVTPLPAVPQVP